MAATITYASSRVTISGAYKAFTCTTSTTTVITYTAGDAPASGDAGRFIVWCKGGTTTTGPWQVRRIISATATTVTVHEAFSTTPTNGDTFRISSNIEDVLAAQPTAVTKTGTAMYAVAGDLQLSSLAFFGSADESIEWKRTASTLLFPLSANTVLQVGQLWGGEGSGRQTTNGSRWSVQATSSDTISLYDSNNAINTAGAVCNFYGSLIESSHPGTPSGSNFMFQRMTGPTRFIGCIFDGQMGGRFYHDASEWVDCRMSGNDALTPAWSMGVTLTRSPDGIAFFKNSYCIKNYQTFDGSLRNITFYSSNTYVLERTAGYTDSDFTFIDCTEFTASQMTASGGNVYQYRSANLTTTDSSGTVLSGVVVRINNTLDETQGSVQTSDGSGVVAEILCKRYQALHGATSLTSYAPFRIRLRKYGYLWSALQSAIADPIKQSNAVLVDANVTQSSATAQAHTGITVTDHGASPVSWNSKSWGITVTCDLTVNPTLTVSDLKHYLHYHLAQSATFNGKAGPAWHDLIPMNGTGTTRDTYVSGAYKGVRVIDQAGNPFNGITEMTADDGTTYTPPTTDTRGLSFTGLIAGSQVVVFETGTTTELFRDNTSSTSESWSESASGSRTVDYTIMKAGYRPIRVTGITVTGAVTGGVLDVPVTQSIDRTYVASSGLTYTTDTTATAGTKLFTLRLASTVQNWYSHMMEVWIAQAAFANVEFPLSSNGPNSITLGNGWEWRGWSTAGTGVSNSSLALLSRDGMRYLDTGGTATAIWAAILTSGVSSGMRVRYQQSDAGTTVDAAVTSGNMDELVQVYGDASHGNFDKRGYLVLKVQEMGYDQAEANVVTTYGNLEDQLYVVGLAPAANGVATGNPSLTTAPTISQGTYVEDGKTFSVKIVDGATANTGTNIMRWLRYNFETGGAFQSEDAFNWHDLVRTNGTKFKTVNGTVYGTATTKGVLVYRNDGTTLHPDFTLFTADNGTTYEPIIPVTAAATILAGSRVQLYNVTTATEIDNAVEATTSYEYTITTEASDGDTLRLRVTKLGYDPEEVFAVFDSVSGAAFLVSQSLDPIYTAWGIDGSTVSEFSLDVTGNIEIDANDVDGATTKTRLGAFYNYALTTENGIRSAYGAISALATNAIRINVDVVDLTIENTNATTALRFTDTDVRLYRSDGTTIIAATSYSIHNDYSGVPDVVETGVSGLTGSESAQLMGLTNAPSADTVATAVWSKTLPL